METSKYVERKKLEELVQKIDRDVDSAVVEGLADRKVLEGLGFTGKIFLSAERTLEGLVEDVSRGSSRVAVLTDFDSHGREQGREISRRLEKNVDVLRTARKEFGEQLTSTGRRAVEDVGPLFRSKEQKFVDAALSRLYTRNR